MDTTKSSASALPSRPAVYQETPHGCYDGWVYLGFEGEDSEANGEHVEEIERVPCRRCADSR